MKYTKNKKAFALAIVLWISAILIASTLYILTLYKKSVSNAGLLNIKLEEQLVADSTIEKIKYYVLTAKFEKNYFTNDLHGLPDKLFVDGREQNITTNDFNITISIIANGISNPVYSINIIKLDNLIKYYTKKNIDYKSSYQDWIDMDSNTRLNGAENGYYKVLNKKYTCSNRGFIQHPDELYLIKNFSSIKPDIQKKINKYIILSIYSNFVLEGLKPQDIKKMVLNLNSYEYNQLKLLYKSNHIEYLSKITSILSKSDYENIANNKPLTINGYIYIINKNKNVSIKKHFIFLNKKYKEKAYLLFKNALSK